MPVLTELLPALNDRRPPPRPDFLPLGPFNTPPLGWLTEADEDRRAKKSRDS